MPNLCFHRDPEKTEKEEWAAVEKTVTEEEFQSEILNELLQLPSSLLFS